MMNAENERAVLHVRETYGVTACNVYDINPKDKTRVNRVRSVNKQWQSLTCFFMTVFLPHGYPESVSKDYLQYQIWDSIQAFASSITGSICTHAVLKGAGVGDENASVLAATITWLIKDGTSMVGKIVFAWLQGTKLDSECKKWRLFADVMNDFAMFLDLLSGYFQNYFTLIICTSGLVKSLVGVAGGSTRAALTQHQARKNNMADVSAKDGSQETLVNLLALICSLILVPVVTKSLMLTWMMYASMTVLHLTANYFAVRSVIMETFNLARYRIFANHYLDEGMTSNHFLSVDEVNRRENVFFSIQPEDTDIKLGASFKDIIEDRSSIEVAKILHLYRESDYILCFSKEVTSKVVINIALSHKTTVLTQMEALYQACFLNYILRNQHIDLHGEDNQLYYESSSRDYTKKTFPDFIKCMKNNGFNVKSAFFNTDMWRIEWALSSLNTGFRGKLITHYC